MGITKDGIEGEQKLFDLLRQKGYKFFQPDAIGLKNDTYYVFEAKHQEYYKKPPFDGHGLPKWQVEARLKFQKRTNIVSVLVVFEKPYETTKTIYYQRLDKLEEGEHFDTQDNNPRRIYLLSNFKKIIAKGNLDNE